MGKGGRSSPNSRWRTALLALAAAALIVTGCGDDDGGESAGSSATDEEQITQVGNAWAEPFGNGEEAMCEYLHPDLAPEACEEAGYLDGSLTQSSELQSSFADATVESVEVRGDTAIAGFTNGHSIKLMTDPDGEWKVIETARAAFSGSDEIVEPDF